jgi:hypothetical protein
VRRCRPKEAAKLAFALLQASPADALRRAAVMSLEDACLHPLLPAVVWLMMAQAKGYSLNFDHKAMVVRFFYELAASHVRDVHPDPSASAPQQTEQHESVATESGSHFGAGGGGTGASLRLMESPPFMCTFTPTFVIFWFVLVGRIVEHVCA